MPTYEYRCQKCEAVVEIVQRADALPRTVCGSDCVAEGRPGDGRLVKLISRVAAHTGGRRAEAPPAAAPAAKESSVHVCGPGCRHGEPAVPSGSCVGEKVRRKYGLS
jgi:putative FmdB family regulatory protein